MRKILKTILLLALAGATVFGVVACASPSDGESAYLTIDINPSIEMLIVDGEVESVKAANDDAAVLLSGENLEGMSVEEATEHIVELSEQMGYLNENNDGVSLSVAADSDEASADIVEKAKNGAKKGSSIAKVNANVRSLDQKRVRELKEENPELYAKLTPAKLRLIDAIMTYDDTMTYEKGTNMKVSELADILKIHKSMLDDIVGDKLEKAYKDSLKTDRHEIKRRIAAIYGEEYLAKWDIAKAIEKIADRIEDTLPENTDENAYILTDAELAEIEQIYGSPVNVTTLAELEDLADELEDQLEQITESTELTEEQKAQIKAIRDEFSALKNNVKDKMKSDIEKAKADFKAKKDQLLKKKN